MSKIFDNIETKFEEGLHVLGYEVLVPQQKSDSKTIYFYCRGAGADAKGYPTKDGFVVMKDSVVSDHLISSFEKQCRHNFINRKELESSGVIVKRKFTRDYTFGSPSGASSAILGRLLNGYADWKTKGKQKLADFRE